jgi:ribosomal protein S18 acetylase RimI-like enzyme
MQILSKSGLINQPKVTLEPAKSSDKALVGKMFRNLVKDMWTDYKEGLTFSESGNLNEAKLKKFIADYITSQRFYIARSNQQVVGFIALSLDRTHPRCIEYAYVEKFARGVGIGSQLYRLAIKELGAHSISLLYRRVNSKITYWQSLGFRSITFRNSQSTQYGNIVKLSIEEFPSILSCKLDSKVIWAFRKRLQKAELQIKTVEADSKKLRLKVSPTLFSEALRLKRIA